MKRGLLKRLTHACAPPITRSLGNPLSTQNRSVILKAPIERIRWLLVSSNSTRPLVSGKPCQIWNSFLGDNLLRSSGCQSPPKEPEVPSPEDVAVGSCCCVTRADELLGQARHQPFSPAQVNINTSSATCKTLDSSYTERSAGVTWSLRERWLGKQACAS